MQLFQHAVDGFSFVIFAFNKHFEKHPTALILLKTEAPLDFLWPGQQACLRGPSW